jgi:hypothetical protein
MSETARWVGTMLAALGIILLLAYAGADRGGAGVRRDRRLDRVVRPCRTGLSHLTMEAWDQRLRR